MITTILIAIGLTILYCGFVTGVILYVRHLSPDMTDDEFMEMMLEGDRMMMIHFPHMRII